MNKLKSLGGALLGFSIFAAILIGASLIFAFGAKLALTIAPFINGLAGFLFVIDIFMLIFALIPKARPAVGLVLYVSSYVFGLATWVYGLAVTLSLWGVLALIIGLFLGGVGVVPIGMLAAIFHGQGGVFLTLLLTSLLTYGTRFVGLALIESKPIEPSRHQNVIDIEPTKPVKRTWEDID